MSDIKFENRVAIVTGAGAVLAVPMLWPLRHAA